MELNLRRSPGNVQESKNGSRFSLAFPAGRALTIGPTEGHCAVVES
jgi:hypothetical protein